MHRPSNHISASLSLSPSLCGADRPRFGAPSNRAGRARAASGAQRPLSRLDLLRLRRIPGRAGAKFREDRRVSCCRRRVLCLALRLFVVYFSCCRPEPCSLQSVSDEAPILCSAALLTPLRTPPLAVGRHGHEGDVPH